MIQRPTVLILGAGASHPYGYPLGWDLARCEAREGDVNEFRTRLQGSGLTSLDAFLEGNEDELVRIGKLIIAAELLSSVDQAKLTNLDVAGHWYRYLWNHLRQGATRETFTGNRLSVITFNYDVSLERFFTNAIFHTFGLRWKDAAELFGRTVKVVHVHGDIGGADAYENRPRPQPGVLVRQAAERIKVVHDEVGSSAEFDAARELISTAEIACFLGFGYHPANIKRLQINQRLRDGAALYGSTFKMGAAEVARAQQHLGRTQFHPYDAEQFLREVAIF